MPIPKSIQITIPTPCSQSWEGMTPDGEGRFCDHCSKTVIDFTGWSDKALFEFFSKDRGQICGHITASRLERPIHIPSQPHSRLYRIAIAMGLALIFAQGETVYAQVKAPMVQTLPANAISASSSVEHAQPGIVKGTVVDEKKETVIGATVRIFHGDLLKGDAVTDIDGNYEVAGLEDGTYHMVLSYLGYKTVTIRKIKVSRERGTVQNAELEAMANGEMIIHCNYDFSDPPGHRTFRREETNTMPIR